MLAELSLPASLVQPSKLYQLVLIAGKLHSPLILFTGYPRSVQRSCAGGLPAGPEEGPAECRPGPEHGGSPRHCCEGVEQRQVQQGELHHSVHDGLGLGQHRKHQGADRLADSAALQLVHHKGGLQVRPPALFQFIFLTCYII